MRINETKLLGQELTQCAATNRELISVSERLTKAEGELVCLFKGMVEGAEGKDPAEVSREFRIVSTCASFDVARREMGACLEVLRSCKLTLEASRNSLFELATAKSKALRVVSSRHRQVSQRITLLETARKGIEERVESVLERCERIRAQPEDRFAPEKTSPLPPDLDEEEDEPINVAIEIISDEKQQPSAEPTPIDGENPALKPVDVRKESVSHPLRHKKSCTQVLCGLGSSAMVIAAAIGAISLKVFYPNLFP